MPKNGGKWPVIEKRFQDWNELPRGKKCNLIIINIFSRELSLDSSTLSSYTPIFRAVCLPNTTLWIVMARSYPDQLMAYYYETYLTIVRSSPWLLP